MISASATDVGWIKRGSALANWCLTPMAFPSLLVPVVEKHFAGFRVEVEL